MIFNPLNEISKWRKSKEQRAVAFVRLIVYTTLTLSVIWLIISLYQQIYSVVAGNLLLFILSVYSVRLVQKKQLTKATIPILIAATVYFFFISYFVSGHGMTGNGTAHFWFILLSIVSYFLFYHFKPIIRDGISLTLLLLFFLFHFGIMPVQQIFRMPPAQDLLINELSSVSFLIALYFFTRYFVLEITRAEEALATAADKLEGLTESVIPKSIAERLNLEGGTFADDYEECSVLFADIVGFTSWAESRSPQEVVNYLNNVFTKFDEAVERGGLTKIKTAGDSYMVASGIPESRKDHASALVTLAFEFHRIASESGELKFRAGINSGPVVAGIIGKKIFAYDIWGDSVNIAARIEACGEAGKVNISGSTYELIKNDFICRHRGKIEAKNKGQIDMYFVEQPVTVTAFSPVDPVPVQ